MSLPAQKFEAEPVAATVSPPPGGRVVGLPRAASPISALALRQAGKVASLVLPPLAALGVLMTLWQGLAGGERAAAFPPRP